MCLQRGTPLYDGRAPVHDAVVSVAPGTIRPMPSDPPNEALTDVQLAVLEIESRTWRYAGVKEAHIRAELGMTPTRYYAVLNRLLDDPAAEAAYPQLVRRLRRLREARVRARSPRVA